ncbi:RNA polymerase sigma-70 factor (ECF subfamily) [Saccharothrix saharensis]|uniref:RNA polymerase sigma-70 factor (ECF subfamily) n=1 Tax=Saccharothrix saharensis TaxID=571190 RepID=A0A543J6H8_9PSEU|nr:sigma-70 family RNA polymerase sigma factor [Saccharothrix saharensis]TQM78440.1 RNA polymerase sigma-70 factor (ECF subfamily) [Saccharothrix saharensis]
MHDELADRFEAHRADLRAVAHRMLGSAAEAEDAVQETWLRLCRVDADEVDNLAAWLRTVVSRVCLDALRRRRTRREDTVDHVPDTPADDDPEFEALLADSIGRALLVVLDTLTPAERIAFVLHDTFAVPFDRIAPILGRSSATTKKLASRARHKVRGTSQLPPAELTRQRHVVDAFLTAARAGDFDALLTVLDPDVVRRADPAALPPGAAVEVRGAHAVATETVLLTANARHAAPALVDGRVGIVVAPGGRLRLVLAVTVRDDRIAAYEVIADPGRLRRLTLSVDFYRDLNQGR